MPKTHIVSSERSLGSGQDALPTAAGPVLLRHASTPNASPINPATSPAAPRPRPRESLELESLDVAGVTADAAAPGSDDAAGVAVAAGAAAPSSGSAAVTVNDGSGFSGSSAPAACGWFHLTTLPSE